MLPISTATDYNDVRLVWVSRTPHDAELTDKVCGYNIALTTHFRVYIPSFGAFCRDLFFSSTYCLKEEGNDHHQPKNLRNQSERLLKDHLSLPPSPSFPVLLVLCGWLVHLTSQFTVGLCYSTHICHALFSTINPTLGDWKPKRQQHPKRQTSLHFHSKNQEVSV